MKLSLISIFENDFKAHMDNPNPDDNMYSNFASFISSNPEIKQYWKNRYGEFAMMMVDAADAYYAHQHGLNKALTPHDFFEKWIDQGLDYQDIQHGLKDQHLDERYRNDLMILLKRLRQIDKR